MPSVRSVNRQQGSRCFHWHHNTCPCRRPISPWQPILATESSAFRPMSVASIARGSWRCRGDRLVSSRCPPCPRRHSAWIGSLHLRGVFRFAVRGTLHVSGSGQRSRVVAVQKLREVKQTSRGKRKSLPPPTPVAPQVTARQHAPFLVPPSTASLNITTKVQPRIDNPAKKPRIHHPSVPLDPKPLTEPPQSGGIHTPESRSFPGKISAPRRRLRPLFPELVLFPVDCVHTRPP